MVELFCEPFDCITNISFKKFKDDFKQPFCIDPIN
jgi:hypothetical protein